SLWRCRVGGASFLRAHGRRWLGGMTTLPLGAPPPRERLRPRASAVEQTADFRPAAFLVQFLHGLPLDGVEAPVGRRDLIADLAGYGAALIGVFDGCYFGDSRLQCLRELVCHGLSVGGNTPVLNTVLTPRRVAFKMVLKPTALHRPKRHALLHRCSQAKTGRTPRLHSQAGPNHQVL